MSEGAGAGVRPGAVAALAAVSGVVCLVLLKLWGGATGRELPQLPWLGVVPLLLVAVAVLVAGLQVRRYARGAAVVPPSPQRARGTLVAAQASALGGAALLGWYAANALVHLPNADVSSVRGLMIRAAASAGAALVLAVAGLVAQAWCRIPPGSEDEDGPGEPDAEDLAYG